MCLTSRSPYHRIYQSLILGKYSLAVTTEIVLEYQEIIARKYGEDTADRFVALLNELPNVIHINSYFHWQLIVTDPEDNKYSDCTIAGKADYLVSEDKHFGVLKTLPFLGLEQLGLMLLLNCYNKLVGYY